MAAEQAITQRGGVVPMLVMQRSDDLAQRPALIEPGVYLSYADLIDLGRRIADQLLDASIKPGDVVGLCLSRGSLRIAALLAIWRVGAAAVMLDPAWPARRVTQVLEDAGCDLTLADDDITADALTSAKVIVATTLKAPPGARIADREPHPLSPDDLAYIIYTSGSSGHPKGVEITHGNLAALIEWHNAAFAVTPEDRATHLAGLAFDAAIWEVWPYLAAGASVHIVPDLVRGSAEHLRDWLIDAQATVAFVPTLIAEQLIRMSWPSTSLRYLLTGGDRLRTTPPAELPFTLVNNYGPTECTVVACSGSVSPGKTDGTPSIGRPIAGSYVRILDAAGAPVAPGEIGQIYIGGRTVGRGYRRAPELTAAAFIPDPTSDEPGARLYRTGDLGSWRADGAIDFHGRADDQLKIRGQRVEPDEVAAVLSGHPDVRAAAVTGIRERDEVTLAAYVEPRHEACLGAEELHAYLAERLPEWSLPSHYVAIERLPVTAHGKLDRAALPEPSPANALPTKAHADAATPTEASLLALLGEVLGRREIGVEDNFFLLGGHSLLGTQLVVRATEAFGVELTLRHLFHAPTVRALAAVIEGLVEESVAAMSDDELMQLVHG